jgi:hypothetical protein
MTNQERLLDAAVDVARNLLAFSAYGKSEPKALAALKRRQPGFPRTAYETAMRDAIRVFQTAQRVVDEWYREARQTPRVSGSNMKDICTPRLNQLKPGFPQATYEWLIPWVDMYFHQR